VNRLHTTVAIAALCVGIVGWQVWTANEEVPDAHSTAKAADPSTTSGPVPASASASASASAGPEEAPDAPAPNTLRVLDNDYFAKRLEADPNCHKEYVLHPETGQPVHAFRCDTDEETHPYEQWNEPVLAGLAYGDPVAAEVLGLRHIQSEDPNREALGLMLLYRSVALSGETGAIQRAIGKRYAVVSENHEPNVHNLKQLLVFAIVSTKLGDTRMRPSGIEARLASAEISASEISRIKRSAEQILEEMATIQSELTGNTTIREALKDA
jgi:hypothetical protein